MLKKTSVHNFCELGDRSIDDIIVECKYDFAVKCLEIVDEYKDCETSDYYLFGLRTYETFNAKGRFITYQDKSVEYETLDSNIREFFERYLKRLDNDQIGPIPDCYSNETVKYLLQKIKNTTKEDLGITLTKPEYIRYESLFGLGEFPFMIITIVRIGNKRYYFYQITR